MKFRRHSVRDSHGPSRHDERGVVIMLVAVFMLFVVGAMAALSIDVVTIYTAKSEAQLVADGAALAGARVLANSGATTDPTLLAGAQVIAQTIAIQVAQSSPVGGRTLVAPSEITVSFVTTIPGDPLVIVHVQRTDLPIFFARIWGNRPISISATATAEAYNPSNVGGTSATTAPPVAPICVKPWLLPNEDPSSAAAIKPAIFDPTAGTITNPSLLGWTSSTTTPLVINSACEGGTCSLPQPSPKPWNYFPGDPGDFPPPTYTSPICGSATFTPYQLSIAGCVETPIQCNASVKIDVASYGGDRNTDAADAVNCLTHATNDQGDTLTCTSPPSAPLQFVAGADDPIPGLSRNNVMVSDSLVTVPVFDSTAGANSTVQIIGFVQLFLNPDGLKTSDTGSANGQIKATIVNLVGCGSGPRPGTAINGNGASPVAVRLVTH
jgi:hypothetical protein